jgi:hypothetical protein
LTDSRKCGKLPASWFEFLFTQTTVVVKELRGAGLRVTMPRQAVLTWLAGHPHSTADAIAAGVRDKFGALSLSATCGVVTARTDCATREQQPARQPGPAAGTQFHEEEWQ